MDMCKKNKKKNQRQEAKLVYVHYTRTMHGKGEKGGRGVSSMDNCTPLVDPAALTPCHPSRGRKKMQEPGGPLVPCMMERSAMDKWDETCITS